MIPAINSAASGIRQGLDMLDRAAQNIASRSTQVAEGHTSSAGSSGNSGSTGGLVDDLVATIIAKHMVGINSAVFKRANAVAGTLIDIVR